MAGRGVGGGAAAVARRPPPRLPQLLPGARRGQGSTRSGREGKLRGRKPRFKSRHHDQAVQVQGQNSRFRVLPDGRLSLPKDGHLKSAGRRPLPSDPSRVTITLDGAGRSRPQSWSRSGRCRCPRWTTAVGVDLGLTSFAALSTGRRRSTTRVGCGSGRRRCADPSATWPASGKAARTGRRPVAGSPGCTLGWPTPAGTSTISSPPAWSASTRRCAWKPSTSPGSAALSWPRAIHDAGLGQFTAMLEYKAALDGRPSRQD